jgi:octaprenyl-diphosphate synthase
MIRGLLCEATSAERWRLRPYLDEAGALDYTWKCAKEHIQQAESALDCLADSDAKRALRVLAQYVARRAS